jgi:tripartite-type tricarboxylate transporter receptor subunit TctC
MLSRRELLRTAAVASVAMPYIGNGAFAQDAWPSREVHAVCGFPPGSGADIFVRFYAKKFQDAIGKTVIVENKTGAFGNIATEYLSKAKPDGYTIGIMPGSSFLAAAASLFNKLPFDPINGFEHVALLSKLPFLLVVSGDGPFKTLPELTAFLKEKGDKGSYGSLANTGIVSSELYKAQFGLKTVEVKYKDAGAALNDLYGNNIAFLHIDPAFAAAHVKSGKLRALATSAADRLQALKDIPSAKDVGIMNSNIIAWWSVHMPKGTPKPLVDKLSKIFQEVAVADDTKKFLADSGSDPFPGGPEQLKELLIADTKAWSEYVKLAKIEKVG